MNNEHLLTLGWDIGGAHLKAALVDGNGRALRVFQLSCPLWRGLQYLEQTVAQVLAELGMVDVRHAITMTGELADIFLSRATGVEQITQTMVRCLESHEMVVYAGRAGFVSQVDAGQRVADIASANWHASAAFLADAAGDALFVDIGSTTSDFAVLGQGRVQALGYSDAERLRCEELVYTGVVRTPVMAVAQRVPFAGAWQRLAAEHFATTADIYRLTGELDEACDMAETADGAEKSLQASARRLARMVGCDLQDAAMLRWRELALVLRSRQLATLQDAAERHLSRGLLAQDAPFIGAGAGRFLVRALAGRMGRDYRDATEFIAAAPEVAPWAGVCLPACAVARLAQGTQPC